MPILTRPQWRIRSAALLLASTMLSPVLLAAPAQAEPAVDVTCVGTETETFTPGLTLLQQDVTVGFDVKLIVCESSSQPGITSGTSVSTYLAREVSCLRIASAGSGSAVIVWNDGRTSTFAYNLTASSVNGTTVAIQTGTITAGLFAGRSATRVITSPNLDLLACATPQGVRSKFATVTFTVFAA